MATRGRRPMSTALKRLEGNPGKRPINGHEPIMPKGSIKCPVWILPEAKQEQMRLAPALDAMGVRTMADRTAFEGYGQVLLSDGHLWDLLHASALPRMPSPR